MFKYEKHDTSDVLRMLENQTFYEWYKGNFEKYIKADEGAPNKDKILAELEAMLHKHSLKK